MLDLVSELSERARQLVPEDRARLAEELLASLDTSFPAETESEWDKKLRERIARLEAGTARLTPADEVFARARRALM